ncbi:unnamed protein product [Cercospora beticola]|nr:unnamed protein product [Cercospora beticola]
MGDNNTGVPSCPQTFLAFSEDTAFPSARRSLCVSMATTRNLVYFVIWSCSWFAIRGGAAPNPAHNAAGLSFTPANDQEDKLDHEILAGPVDNAQALLQDLHGRYLSTLSDVLGEGCTEENIIVRKEWSDLTPDERREYIDACKCLHDKPSRTPKDAAPGAKTRWDDFVVAHILASDDVHRSPKLLAYHRLYLHELEKALRDECGYTGGQPYWLWSRFYGQPIDSYPIFDGSDTSLSGNGKEDTPEKGCYCITEGPLKDWRVHLGPAAGNDACTQNPQDDGLGLNDRCLERNFDKKYLGNLTYDNVTFTINNFKDIDGFGVYIESWPVGVHQLPHVFMGGTNADVPSAASDPWFPCHHAALDFIWILWQSIDLDNRTLALGKAESYADLRKRSQAPPATGIGLDDDLSISPYFDKVKVRDIMSPTGGHLCYRYE